MEKHQNCDQKLPNVTSAATAAPALATPSVQKTAPEWENTKRMILATKLSKLRNGASAMPKQQGPEGRKSIKIATKNSLM